MGQRPAHLKPPAYLSKSPPVPEPEKMPDEACAAKPGAPENSARDPTRYGDWELKGIAVDF